MGARPGLRDLRHRPGVGAARARRARAGRRRPAARWRRATGLGAASSSCSYAAIAIAKSLFQKGASAASALAFQFASTNLVWELGLVLWVLIGWQFTLAEYLGGIVMIALMWLLLRALRLAPATRPSRASTPSTRRRRPPAPRRRQRALPWRERLTSAQAWSDVAHNFRGDWQMLWKEILDRLPARRLHRAAGRRLLQRPLPRRRARGGPDAVGRAHRPRHRRAELRLLGRQRPAGRRAVVGRPQLRRRDGLHLRRPDRAADHRSPTASTTAPRFALRITALMFVTMVLAALVVDLVFSAAGPDPRRAPDHQRRLRLDRARLQARAERHRDARSSSRSSA